MLPVNHHILVLLPNVRLRERHKAALKPAMKKVEFYNTDNNTEVLSFIQQVLGPVQTLSLFCTSIYSTHHYASFLTTFDFFCSKLCSRRLPPEASLASLFAGADKTKKRTAEDFVKTYHSLLFQSIDIPLVEIPFPDSESTFPEYHTAPTYTIRPAS